MVIGKICGDERGHGMMCLLRVAAEVLGQAVRDAAEGMACGLISRDEEMRVLRQRAPVKHSVPSTASEADSVDAAMFFRDGRAAELCELIEVLAPRSALSVGYLRRLAVKWSGLPKRERGVDHSHALVKGDEEDERLEEERWGGSE
jgi:hypothetical protein